MRLAQQAVLLDAATDWVRLPTYKDADPAGKVATIVAGMLAGADSADDLHSARRGGVRSLFTSVYAPSTLRSSCAQSPTDMYGSYKPPPVTA